MSTYTVLSQTREGDAFHVVVRVTNDAGATCDYGHWLTDEQNAAVLADETAMRGIVVEVVASALLHLEAITPPPVRVEAPAETLTALSAYATRTRVEEAVADEREARSIAEAERAREGDAGELVGVAR